MRSRTVSRRRPDPTRQRDESDNGEDDPRPDDDGRHQWDGRAAAGSFREESEVVGTDEDDGRGDSERQPDEYPPNRVALGYEEWSAEAEI